MFLDSGSNTHSQVCRRGPVWVPSVSSTLMALQAGWTPVPGGLIVLSRNADDVPIAEPGAIFSG